ncbi:MAG: accessory gene regulator ArgB-like protein [Butyrivibrio sp.]
MDKLLDRIMVFICKNTSPDEDEYEIIRYGLELMLLKSAFYIGALIIGAVSGHFPECILFMALFVPIRVFAGGYHLDTRLKCAVISSCILTVSVVLIFYMQSNPILRDVFGITAAVFGVVIFWAAPVDNPNKRLSLKQQRKIRLKVKIILAVYLVAAVVSAITGCDILLCGITVSVNIEGMLVFLGMLKNRHIQHI